MENGKMENGKMQNVKNDDENALCLRLKELEMLKMQKIKEYIKYDQLVDDLIYEKQLLIKKAEIEILGKQSMIEGLYSDINRIQRERQQSNTSQSPTFYNFINPVSEYHKLTKGV